MLKVRSSSLMSYFCLHEGSLKGSCVANPTLSPRLRRQQDPYGCGVGLVVGNYLATVQNSLKFIEQVLIKHFLEQWFAWCKGNVLNFKRREASCWPGQFGDCQEFLHLAKGGMFVVVQQSCKIHSPEGRSFRWVNKTQLIISIILGYPPPLLCKVWETRASISGSQHLTGLDALSQAPEPIVIPSVQKGRWRA